MPAVPASSASPGRRDESVSPQLSSRSPAAVIWISGLGAQGIEEGLEEIAKRVAFACDRRDIAPPTFAVRTAIKPEQAGRNVHVPRCTVLRTDSSGTRPVLDFYGLGTAHTLIGDRAGRSLPSQLAFAVRAVARVMPKAIKTRKRGVGKTRRERTQLLYARLAMIAMIVGLVALLGGLAGTLAVGDLPPWARFLQAPILFFGGLGIWKSSFARKLGSAALVGYSVVDYLDRGGDKGSQLRGQLADLLERLAELEDPPESIDIVAYSFGSIVAIDALFPYVQKPPLRLETVDRLITIACPFDFVRSFWPDYFTRRFSRAGVPGKWVNVYAPSDVLASNFIDGKDGIGEAVNAVEVRDGLPRPSPPHNVAYLMEGREEPVSTGQALLLRGLRFHGQYWSSRIASEESVFDQVVGYLGKDATPRPTGTRAAMRE